MARVSRDEDRCSTSISMAYETTCQEKATQTQLNSQIPASIASKMVQFLTIPRTRCVTILPLGWSIEVNSTSAERPALSKPVNFASWFVANS